MCIRAKIRQRCDAIGASRTKRCLKCICLALTRNINAYMDAGGVQANRVYLCLSSNSSSRNTISGFDPASP